MENAAIKLVSWNVNGLRACMGKGFAQFLEEESPDVLCLQETKMQTEQADFAELVQASALPAFVSDMAMRYDGKPKNRVVLPVLDPEATATYYFVCRKGEKSKLAALIQRVNSNRK